MQKYSKEQFDDLIAQIINVSTVVASTQQKTQIEEVLEAAGVLGPVDHERSVFLDTVMVLRDRDMVFRMSNLYPYFLGAVYQQLWKQYQVWYVWEHSNPQDFVHQ